MKNPSLMAAMLGLIDSTVPDAMRFMPGPDDPLPCLKCMFDIRAGQCVCKYRRSQGTLTEQEAKARDEQRRRSIKGKKGKR